MRGSHCSLTPNKMVGTKPSKFQSKSGIVPQGQSLLTIKETTAK
jgi:hypothetical protein